MLIIIVFSVLFCTFVLTLCGHTMWKLMWFLSSTDVLRQNSSNQSENLFLSLWLNICLVILFIFQHSYLKTIHIANYLARYRITSAIARSIYVILTSVTLQIIVQFWSPTSSYVFWKLNDNSSTLCWGFSLIHLLSWASIYGGSVILDLPDLVGVKQVYYYCLNLPETTDLKSTELQRLYSHKRHPSFIGFLSLLWITPIMSLDRFLLALALTLYMATAWEPTPDDKRYHQRQLVQKQQEVAYRTRRTNLSFEQRNYRG